MLLWLWLATEAGATRRARTPAEDRQTRERQLLHHKPTCSEETASALPFASSCQAFLRFCTVSTTTYFKVKTLLVSQLGSSKHSTGPCKIHYIKSSRCAHSSAA
ncbi:hypothetical protein M3J09_013509 [Ascochyta lentis]